MGFRNTWKARKYRQRAYQPIAALDQGYVSQQCVLLTSIYLNNPGEHFELYLLHSQLPDACYSQIMQCCAKFGYACYPIRVDDGLFRDAPASSRYPTTISSGTTR